MSGTAHIVIPTVAKDGPSQATVLTSDSPAAHVNAVFDGLDEHLADTRGLPVEDRLTAFIPHSSNGV